MTTVEAMSWVETNLPMIKTMVVKYQNFSPYGVDDYIQDAYAAACESSIICTKNPSKNFKNVFYTIFTRRVGQVTPFPEEDRDKYRSKKQAAGNPDSSSPNEKKKRYYSGGACTSPRSDKQVYGVDLSNIPAKSSRHIDLEKVYSEHIAPRTDIPDRDKEILALAIGIGDNGRLSNSEMANRFGVHENTIRYRRQKIQTKLGEIINEAANKCFDQDDSRVEIKEESISNPEYSLVAVG